MSTHNLCFSAKIRKMYTPEHQFHYIKVGCKGVFITQTCFHDGIIMGTYIIGFYEEMAKIIFQSSLNIIKYALDLFF